MEHLTLSASKEFPGINFDPSTGKLSIIGKSYMEDAVSFYNPVIDWLKKYCSQPADETNLTIGLEYMNTSSSKYILDVFDLLNQLFKKGNNVYVIWQYNAEDEDMEEQGRQYEDIFNLPFQFIAV